MARPSKCSISLFPVPHRQQLQSRTSSGQSHSLAGMQPNSKSKDVKQGSGLKNGRCWNHCPIQHSSTSSRCRLGKEPCNGSILRNLLVHRSAFTRDHSACGGGRWCDVLRRGYLGWFFQTCCLLAHGLVGGGGTEEPLYGAKITMVAEGRLGFTIWVFGGSSILRSFLFVCRQSHGTKFYERWRKYGILLLCKDIITKQGLGSCGKWQSERVFSSVRASSLTTLHLTKIIHAPKNQISPP